MDITVKGINKEIYRIFKAEAVKKGKTLREAIDEAMELWLEKGKWQLLKNKIFIKKAIEHMDKNRKKIESIDTVSIIRKWRDFY